jgi:hypothetical protein
MTTDNSSEDAQLCEECETEMHLRQSWTGQTYYMCPDCN